MSKAPITIKLMGSLGLHQQEGGFASHQVEVDGECLADVVGKKLGYNVSSRGYSTVDGGVGRCELTLLLWPDA